MKTYIVLVLLLILNVNLSAQSTTTYGSWNMLALKLPLNEKLTLGYNHIFLRQDDFYKSSNRMFGDLTLSYKMDANWSFQMLNRYVTVPEKDNDAYWVFLDANYTLKKEDSPFSMKARMRLHLGSELLNEAIQGDFLRPAIFVYLNTIPNITPFLSAEPFYQFNAVNDFQRIRYELGAQFKFSKKFGGVLMYRIEDLVKSNPKTDAHFIVAGLSYKLK